ncbi:flagellar hook-basal body protein [Microbulbifer zhoushanensis]|uniref:flagellar hook-basal body protein n=1 Tax=Microbulbifer zhoushanensis TaxID=2904254 RepID=UPI001F278C0A|nr:flagellar hook-basal body complex protein [Microbulbifer zhoushanensis]
MDSVLAIAEANISARMEQISVSSNNVANMSTTGYRSSLLVEPSFERAYTEAQGSIHKGHYTHVDFTPGNIRTTGRSLDFALAGDGFFKLDTTSGTYLTRNGQFNIAEGGQLVGANGWPVSLVGQQAPLDRDIEVRQDGRIFSKGEEVARFDIVISDGSQMEEVAPGLYKVGESGLEGHENPQLIQSHLEASNVNMLHEMQKMMSAVRSIESSQKILRNYDALMDTAITTLGEF